MAFISEPPAIHFTKPLFCGILGNTLISTVPGISGAGPTPEKTLLTPILDAEFITCGEITSLPFKPNTPTGCPTPATITRSMMELTGITPLFINAGLRHPPTVPCLDVLGQVGGDPRYGDAVPAVDGLYMRGRIAGKFLSSVSDLLVLGECVPGGTTTALCVLRALGCHAAVSSSFANNPVNLKEEICDQVLSRIKNEHVTKPLDILRVTGDPMMPVAVGIADSYAGTLVLAGGTQMLAVCGVIKAMKARMPIIATTAYVRDDPTANVQEIVHQVGVTVYYVDPAFGDLGHAGLARYCIGEVKEGMGAGGSMFLAYLMGHSPDKIRGKILETVNQYS
ncbi:MAG: TIGR00303 family protein [Methanoregula sp.]|jgi:uncharacterized protein (TIGR00303 family)